MTSPRVRRGGKTEELVAEFLRLHGWLDAASTNRSTPGKDVVGVPGHSIEVKARAGFDPLSALRQAKANAESGDRPCVVLRMNGQGSASVGKFLVIRRLEDDELTLGPDEDELAEGRSGESFAPACPACRCTSSQWDSLEFLPCGKTRWINGFTYQTIKGPILVVTCQLCGFQRTRNVDISIT